MLDHWSRITSTDTVVTWANQSGELIMITQPDSYDFWNIYDSTGEVVDGRSLGPFNTFKQAKERVREDVNI